MNDAEFVIETHGLSKDYADRTVLRDIDLALCGGQIVCLMGGNGAGKTTLLGCLASLVRPTSGVVRWFGCPAASAPSARRWIGMLAHESRLYPQLTLRENLVFSGRMYGMDQPLAVATSWLDEIHMSAHAERFPLQVSRGMRQRVALASALLHEPRILLLDEPYTGLDDAGTAWLTQRLQGLRAAGRLIMLTMHDAAKAAELADRLCLLKSGRLSDISPRDEARTTQPERPARAA